MQSLKDIDWAQFSYEFLGTVIAINIFNKEAPTISDSAITRDPGKAYVKKAEKILCWIEKPTFFSNAPIAIKLAAKAKAGLFMPLIEENPSQKYFLFKDSFYCIAESLNQIEGCINEFIKN